MVFFFSFIAGGVVFAFSSGRRDSPLPHFVHYGLFILLFFLPSFPGLETTFSPFFFLAVFSRLLAQTYAKPKTFFFLQEVSSLSSDFRQAASLLFFSKSSQIQGIK